MIAANYARKSTEQHGVADEAKSVARQIALAREFAARRGWTIPDAHVYVDDGVSGAEFELPQNASAAGVLGPEGRAVLERAD